MKTLRANPDKGPETGEPRRQLRRRVSLSGFLQLENLTAFAVEVLDLSYNGCKAAVPVALLPGTAIKLIVSRLGSVPGKVRWYRDGLVGLAFDEPDRSRAHVPRKFDRRLVGIEVGLRQAGRSNYRSTLIDLSPQGCKVEFVERPRSLTQVWVKLPGLEAIPATVRWVGGFQGGVEFERNIHPAVFDLLLQRLRAEHVG